MCNTQIEFYQPLPSELFIKIQSLYSNLPVKSLTKNHIMFQEGCVSTFIELIQSGLNITSRVIRLPGLNFKIKESEEHFTNTLLCLFNEYRIMMESVLLKSSMPYKVCSLILMRLIDSFNINHHLKHKSTNVDGFKSYKKMYTNFENTSISNFFD